LRSNFADGLGATSTEPGISVFARHDAYNLAGQMIIGASLPSASLSGRAFVKLRDFALKLAQPQITQAETDQAKRAYLGELNARLQSTEQTLSGLIDQSSGLPRAEEDRMMTERITVTDLNRVAVKMFGGTTQGFASVIVGDANALREELTRAKIEVDSTVAVKK